MRNETRDSVCAVVVTYNRNELLLKALNSLLRQQRPVQAIYLIDNASTDNTPEALIAAGFLDAAPSDDLHDPWERENTVQAEEGGEPCPLFYVRMPTNTGGAGGFNEGMKRAYERGFQWFWLMDDDVTFYKSALGSMLEYKNVSSLIQPNKIHFDGTPFHWDGFIDLKFGLQCRTGNIFLKNKEFCFVNRACFEGMLITRGVVDQIGFPDPHFFAVGDDTVYGILASEFTNPIYLKEVLAVKQRKENTRRRSALKRYLMMRNRFFKLRYIKKYPAFSRLAYLFLLFFLGKYLLASVVKEKSMRNFVAVLRGFKDGMLNIAGREKRFLARISQKFGLKQNF